MVESLYSASELCEVSFGQMKWMHEASHPLHDFVKPKNRVELDLHSLDEYFFRTAPIREKWHVGMNRNPFDGHAGVLLEVQLVNVNAL